MDEFKIYVRWNERQRRLEKGFVRTHPMRTLFLINSPYHSRNERIISYDICPIDARTKVVSNPARKIVADSNASFLLLLCSPPRIWVLPRFTQARADAVLFSSNDRTAAWAIDEMKLFYFRTSLRVLMLHRSDLIRNSMEGGCLEAMPSGALVFVMQRSWSCQLRSRDDTQPVLRRLDAFSTIIILAPGVDYG